VRGAIGIVSLIAGFACLAVLIPGAAGAAEPVWLCKPGIPDNPCAPSLDTTLVSPSGETLGVRHIRPRKHPKIDCFYVYPTVSGQRTANANLNIDPEERSIALYQAARYSQECRVFAPMYRQLTIAALTGTAPGADLNLAYSDVLNAWNTYLQKYNHGRGVVLIGHSQGTGMLARLVREQIDPNPAERSRLVSALLLGGPSRLGGITVPQGRDVGGSFQNVPACRSESQVGCVVAFSTFNAPVPANAGFGRTTLPGQQILCTNPASLGGGSAPLKTIFPTEPFAPGTVIGGLTTAVGFTLPAVSTPWVEVAGEFSGQCSSADNASVLQITGVPGAPQLHPLPDATWGLHLLDANIALGDLLDLVHDQAKAFKHASKGFKQHK
jgi:Protein of unknown function (DUF3089)